MQNLAGESVDARYNYTEGKKREKSIKSLFLVDVRGHRLLA
jgi:hypothetical protein